MKFYDPILVALDVDNADDAMRLVKMLGGKVGGFKVGLELVNSVGMDILSRISEYGNVFYDAKFHDIPNTVAGAVRASARRGVWMVNIHISGGNAMLDAAQEAAHTVDKPPLLIGVTVLTSIDQAILNNDLRTPGAVVEQVTHYAQMADRSGLNGVVASPQELSAIRAVCRPNFLTVIPGIRPKGVAANDQKRIATPGQAILDGANYLVVGRAITNASDPVVAADAIAEEIRETIMHRSGE
jgi:orotidine-5'-phosphate decarboxylase